MEPIEHNFKIETSHAGVVWSTENFVNQKLVLCTYSNLILEQRLVICKLNYRLKSAASQSGMISPQTQGTTPARRKSENESIGRHSFSSGTSEGDGTRKRTHHKAG